MGGKKADRVSKQLETIYSKLFASFGPQGWWPAKTRFEVIVGAILTQNTNWKNVEAVIAEMEKRGLLRPKTLDLVPLAELAPLLKRSGYFNQKAKKLKAFMKYFEKYGLSVEAMMRGDKDALRRELLGVWGIGPETADAILLYALDKPVFVVDAYTRRVFSRMGFVADGVSYEDLQRFFESRLAPSVPHFKEFHALIDELAKRHCRPRPMCSECPVGGLCKSKGKLA